MMFVTKLDGENPTPTRMIVGAKLNQGVVLEIQVDRGGHDWDRERIDLNEGQAEELLLWLGQWDQKRK